jgi:hypothetical protein
MKHDELERHEHAARDIIDALGELGRRARAPADFHTNVMTQATQLSLSRFRVLNALQAVWSWQPAWLGQMALVGVFVLALCGAIPQYTTWLNAYLLGVPSGIVHEARMQEQLWEKNFACAMKINGNSQDYAAILGDHVNVVVWACPSGDVLVVLDSPAEQNVKRSVWIPLETVGTAPTRLSFLVQQAFAEDNRQKTRSNGQMTRVLCQKWLPNKNIMRHVQLANGRCRSEVINPRTGRVMDRGAVACDASC